jgi:lipid-A-disaccharide synthase
VAAYGAGEKPTLALFLCQVKGLHACDLQARKGQRDVARAMEDTRQLYFVAGEVSGDTHGAAVLAVLRARRPGWGFHGRGGPRMREIAGADLQDWCDLAAVVGLWEVLKRYGYFRTQFAQVLAEIDRVRPAAVVLIDYPGFNLRLAAELRRRKLPLKIIYYISPQVWAWHRGRIPRMARLLDLMICIFPFEPALYEPAGLKSVFAGHPLVAALQAAEPENTAREMELVGLFPGSRMREVRKIFPIMLAAARLLQRQRPGLRFATAAPSARVAAELGRLRAEANWTEAEIPIGIGDARALMRRAGAGLVASGTATVEAASLEMPMAILYRVSWLTYWVGRAVVRVPFLGMVNLLAGREIVREFLQAAARPEAIAAELLRLLEPAGEARARQLAELRAVVEHLGCGGAAERAAAAILEAVET